MEVRGVFRSWDTLVIRSIFIRSARICLSRMVCRLSLISPSWQEAGYRSDLASREVRTDRSPQIGRASCRERVFGSV